MSGTAYSLLLTQYVYDNRLFNAESIGVLEQTVLLGRKMCGTADMKSSQ
jgi:hypothetical protein